ncbi:hypothetical protein TRIUR3_27849 [Triticum urartu]|uniref:Uncharacterized protein n=1 Tax=Triticum urartu TaxID=4572 RepID=M7ZYS4_TRIUA|nr:hypothetical protein TRIUR3_27849 [Triticum urartu]
MKLLSLPMNSGNKYLSPRYFVFTLVKLMNVNEDYGDLSKVARRVEVHAIAYMVDLRNGLWEKCTATSDHNWDLKAALIHERRQIQKINGLYG